jgi:ADP-ribose pyrophosphatase YjhB (NUDIX family)
MKGIVLATGLVIREDAGETRLLLVASRYANHPLPLWNLPGGRQHPGELLRETVERECYEETGVRVRAGALAYVSESYDGDALHVINATFHVVPLENAAALELPRERDAVDHVVAAEWVAMGDVAARLSVAVVREPLVAYLGGRLEARYQGFSDAGVTIEWPSDSD